MPARLLRDCLAAVLLVVSAPLAAAGGSTFYVFGDSLSDTGNLFAATRTGTGQGIPPATRYVAGRFANGRVWVDYLADALEAGPVRPFLAVGGLAPGVSVNFAYGAAGSGAANRVPETTATVPGLLGQVRQYRNALARTGRGANPEALYILWAGANDYLFRYPNVDGPADVIDNIARAVRGLHRLGARRFMVVNMPPLERVPFARATGIATVVAWQAFDHNRRLNRDLNRLNGELKGLRLAIYRLNSVFRRLTAQAGRYGFDDVESAGPAAGCLLPPGDCSPLASFRTDGFFWDEIHPTTAAHAVFAEEAERVARRLLR